jgi:hypothetical protein
MSDVDVRIRDSDVRLSDVDVLLVIGSVREPEASRASN